MTAMLADLRLLLAAPLLGALLVAVAPARWSRMGTFNAAAALAVWDDEHREAFCAWARAPWFC